MRESLLIRYSGNTLRGGCSLAQPILYRWTEGYRPTRQAWVVVICTVVGAAVGERLLQGFAGPNSAQQIVLDLLGVALAAGLLLGMVRFEASISDGQLLVRSRPLLGGLLNWPWTERRIARSRIRSFRVDENAWSELKLLTILLDDGSPLRIPGPRPTARSDSFDSLVKSLRSFSGADPGSRVEARAWRVPIDRVIVCGVLLASAVYVALTISSAMDKTNTFIVVMGAIFLAVQGVSFLLKRG